MEDERLSILQTKTILYAEDEKHIQNNIKQILELFFKQVYVASDGQEAFYMYEEFSPDVLMLDIYMPLMDGLEVVKKVRKNDVNIPIIMLSAHASQENLFEIVDKKICKFITKPFDIQKLNEALLKCASEFESDDVEVRLRHGIYNQFSKTFIGLNEQITLTKKESQLLDLFIKYKNQVLSYEQIIEFFWENECTKESIKALIKELRKKIGKDDIKNIFGLGYKLEI